MAADFIDYEVVVEIHNAGDHAFLKSLLDAFGITYYFQGEHVAPYLFHSLPMRLMVRKDEAAEAREILRDLHFSSAYTGLKHSTARKDEE